MFSYSIYFQEHLSFKINIGIKRLQSACTILHLLSSEVKKYNKTSSFASLYMYALRGIYINIKER